MVRALFGISIVIANVFSHRQDCETIMQAFNRIEN